MDDCKTKYPILLLHGLNCRDLEPFRYWGRIPSLLRAHGATVYQGGQEACATVAHNATQLRFRVLAILQREKCEKINIIAHSKGGLESRYLISSLGMASSIASLSTISTPHWGLKSLDNWTEKKCLLHTASFAVDSFWRLMGDRNSDFQSVVYSLRPGAMTAFNAENPDNPDVFYQSWSASLGDTRDDRLLSAAGHFFRPADGDNDGLVATNAAHWGLYHGVIPDISHRDVVDSREKDLPTFNVKQFYLDLVRDLVHRGF